MKRELIGILTLILGTMFISYSIIENYHNHNNPSIIISMIVGAILFSFSYLTQTNKPMEVKTE